MSIPKYIPAIGTAGSFEFLSPLDSLSTGNERMILKSVRSISDYLASNEDVYTNIYVKYNITSEYKQDVIDDIEILGIQTERGAWLYVPVRYVKCYPSTNGIPYRAFSIVLPFQALPVDMDLSTLLSQLSAVALAEVGFAVTPRVVAASNVTLVPNEVHTSLEVTRATQKNVHTPYAVNLRLSHDYAILVSRVSELEDYIQSHP